MHKTEHGSYDDKASVLTLRLLGYFAAVFGVCWIFFKITFFENSFRNTLRVSIILDQDQACCFVGPNLVPNYLQLLSADDISRFRVTVIYNVFYFHLSSGINAPYTTSH